MLNKIFVLFLIYSLLSPALLADEIADAEYVKKLEYSRNKLSLVTKKRQIDERRSYSYTDIDSTTYSYEAYSHTDTDISTQTVDRSEIKEVTDWYIYKGQLRELSDLEFLQLVGDRPMINKIAEIEQQKAGMRLWGNIFIGTGLVFMIGGAVTAAGATVTTAGALGMTAGFFISAFNMPPAHYIEPDYAQEKIDVYNISLKKKLGLPLEYN